MQFIYDISLRPVVMWRHGCYSYRFSRRHPEQCTQNTVGGSPREELIEEERVNREFWACVFLDFQFQSKNIFDIVFLR